LQNRKLLISAAKLQSCIDDSDIRIVDCRFDLMQPDAGRTSYLQGHIPGAVYADLDKDLAGPIGPGIGRHPLPDPSELASTFGRLGISASTHVIVYDACSGALAARAWWLLRWVGHEQVSLLEGGISHWQELGLPIEKGDITVTPGIFKSQPRHDLVLATQEIVDAGATCTSLRLVDARDKVRFRGEREPIDNVAGHVPGAMNLPFSASLNDDGSWKSSAELESIWHAVLGPDRDVSWSVMCGSGVTACHLVISGLLAGLTEPRVYVGSWSEWITDPARKVATGAL
jgi:thiosulfate/3-mercaptopyruvate sulfurtransferase